MEAEFCMSVLIVSLVIAYLLFKYYNLYRFWFAQSILFLIFIVHMYFS
jgi:hypothetical protein